MTSAEAVRIVELCLFYSGLVFLVVLLAVALGRLVTHARERSRRQAAGQPGDGPAGAASSFAWPDTLYTASLAALAVAAVGFATLALTPLAPFENFGSHDPMPEHPLHLAQLEQESDDEHTRIFGSILNAARRNLEVHALVLVFDEAGQLMAERSVPIVPAQLPARAIGRFDVTFNKLPAKIYSYSVSFYDAENLPLGHTDRR